MVNIIVAVAQNGVIGGDNALLWHISEDLRRFKQITMGHPVVMGRKTFLSLGRPLPGRRNVVLSRREGLRLEGAEVCPSLEAALALFDPAEQLFVIGGGEVYRQAMELADRLYITRVWHDFGGDTRFPDWDGAEWRLVASERHERGERFPWPFSFECYERVGRSVG